jgi:hypothetical protein
MSWFADRRLVLGAGGVLALLAGLAIAFVLMRRDHAPPQAPPASQGGLVVESGRDDDLKLDPKRPLRCFVNGQFVGELPLAVCAQRNGVATGSLDVGLDQSGSLAASNGAATDITPLPPQPAPEASAAEGEGQSQAADQAPAETGPCWRYGVGGWRQFPNPLSLSSCVQALYAGQCQPEAQLEYGRWGDQTLRLTEGRIEISPDNRDFHSLVDPWEGCAGAGRG